MVDVPPSRSRISRDAFATLVGSAIGLDVTHTWRGYGSAIFLEIGDLSMRSRKNNPRGEYSIMLEWSWRVEGARSVVFGSFSSDRKLASGLRSLQGCTVERMIIEGRLPELVIGLSGPSPRWVHSFMTRAGQPRWSVALPDGSWVIVKRGVLIHLQRSKDDLVRVE